MAAMAENRLLRHYSARTIRNQKKNTQPIPKRKRASGWVFTIV